MKDPLDKKESPYEILGISTDAGKEEVKNALTQALSKQTDKAHIREYRQAWDCIKKLRERIKIDVFQYPLTEPVGLEVGNNELFSGIENFFDMKEFDENINSPDLSSSDFNNEIENFAVRGLHMSDISIYDEINGMILEIKYDK